MIKVTVKYSPIDVNKILYDSMVDNIKEKLKPFEQEIKDSGGEVNIILLPDYQVSLEVNNISGGLKERILSAIQ